MPSTVSNFQGHAGPGSASCCSARLGFVGLGWTRHGTATPAAAGESRRQKCGMARLGLEWLCEPVPGRDGPALARRGKAWLGAATPTAFLRKGRSVAGLARPSLDAVRHSTAARGLARHTAAQVAAEVWRDRVRRGGEGRCDLWPGNAGRCQVWQHTRGGNAPKISRTGTAGLCSAWLGEAWRGLATNTRSAMAGKISRRGRERHGAVWRGWVRQRAALRARDWLGLAPHGKTTLPGNGEKISGIGQDRQAMARLCQARKGWDGKGQAGRGKANITH